MEHIAEEAQSLKDSLDRYDARNQKRATEARERAELLGRAVLNPKSLLTLCLLLQYHVCFCFIYAYVIVM